MGFMEDPTTPTKVDRTPTPGGEDANKWFSAADCNFIYQCLKDIRTYVLALDLSLFSGISTGTFSGPNHNDDTALATNDIYHMTATANTFLTGLTGGVDGRLVILQNVGGGFQVQIPNESASSSAANRIHTPAGGATYIMSDGSGCIARYSGGSVNRWLILTRT